MLLHIGVGLLLIAWGVILITSPLWFAEQNRRGLEKIWGPGNWIVKSIEAQKDPLQVYRRMGVSFVVFAVVWTALAIVFMVRTGQW
ncbi:hypothetical protein ACWEOH_18885 [Agromyces sp. NPDC004153]